jgi:hypothetical protein
MRVKPFHSSEPTLVFHNNNKCTEGNNIEDRNWRAGEGGKRLCKRCRDLNLERK